MASLLFSGLLLSFSPPNVPSRRQPVMSSGSWSNLAVSRPLSAAVLPTIAAPAFAADGGFDLGSAILNVGLTAFVLAFVAYIGSYAVEALGELGEASSNVAERIQGDGSAPQPKSKEPVYDDAFESDLANLRAPVTKKKRIVSDEELAKFAPWMRGIDQDMIEKNQKDRRARNK